MKEFTASGYYVDVGSVKKQLSCKGSSNCEIVCFSVDRYCNAVDLSQCNCTIKTKNSDGKADVILPAIEITRDTVRVLWTVSSASTSVPGELLVQIQFEKIFEDHTKNIVWQSNVMGFEIQESLDSADEVYEQTPSLFQQWDEKMNTAYSDVSERVETVQSLASQVETTAGQVSEQEQNTSQLQVQASQRATEAQNAAQNAQASAAQAKMSAANALAAENLCKEYSNAANAYSQATDASATTAQQQAASAKSDADRAQQTVAGFTGYTKQEAENYFAGAFLGKKTGSSISLDDVQANTFFRSLFVDGQTTETGTGAKSPDNPYTLSGTAKFTVSEEAAQLQTYALTQPLFSLPDATADTFEMVAGVGTQKIRKVTWNGSGNWALYAGSENSTTACFAAVIPSMADRLAGDETTSLCDKLNYVDKPIFVSSTSEGYWPHTSQIYNNACYIRINKSRLTGWDDAWTSTQKNAAFKLWLAANPITLLYELAVPVPFSSAPQQIQAYSPNSQLSVDSGTVTVTYNRDSNQVLKKLENAIILQGGSL